MKKSFMILLLIVLQVACSIRPEPILYGEDNCVLCHMTIMDHRFGTEIVSGKGKVYKFDSIECLVEYLQEMDKRGEPAELVLVTPFDKPGTLADSRESHVLHSRNLPSPMGMYLSAFETEADALSYKDSHGGKVYSWESLLAYYKILRSDNAGH